MTVAVIENGAAGWLALAAFFLLTAVLVGRVTAAAQRRSQLAPPAVYRATARVAAHSRMT